MWFAVQIYAENVSLRYEYFCKYVLSAACGKNHIVCFNLHRATIFFTGTETMQKRLTIISDSSDTVSEIESILGSEEYSFEVIDRNILLIDLAYIQNTDMVIIDATDKYINFISEHLNNTDIKQLKSCISLILDSKYINMFSTFFPTLQVNFFTRPLKEDEFRIRIMKCLFVYMESVHCKDSQNQLNWELSNESSRLDTALQIAEHQSLLLDLILNGINAGIIAVDTSETVVMINKMAELIFNAKGPDSIGKSLWSIITPEVRKHIDNIPASSDSDNPFSNLFVLKYSDNSNHYLHITVRNFFDNEKNIHGRILIFDDVSSRIEALRLRNSFSTIISHELRTPLTIINNNIELLRISGNEQIMTHIIDDIENATERSNELVTKILNIIYLDGVDIRPHYQSASIMDIIKKSILNYQHKISMKGISVATDIQNGLSKFTTDINLITMIISNLIDNAIKFNKNGGTIRVSVYRKEDQICISVSDEGKGIENESESSLFDCFAQGENNITRSHSGIGAGLYIVKKAISLMNGSISFSSSSGHGTTFTTFFPTINISNEVS